MVAGPIVVYMVGKENFWLLYLGGAGFSSLISLIYKKMRRISIPSLVSKCPFGGRGP